MVRSCPSVVLVLVVCPVRKKHTAMSDKRSLADEKALAFCQAKA